MPEMPQHIKPQWFPFIQRLQGAACKQNGLAIVTVSVLVNESGVPVTWTEPHMTRLEPMSRNSDFLLLLAQAPATGD